MSTEKEKQKDQEDLAKRHTKLLDLLDKIPSKLLEEQKKLVDIVQDAVTLGEEMAHAGHSGGLQGVIETTTKDLRDIVKYFERHRKSIISGIGRYHELFSTERAKKALIIEGVPPF